MCAALIPRQSMGVAVPSLFQKDELEHVQSANRMQLMQLLSSTTASTSGDIYELQQRVLDENRPDIHIIPLLCLLALTLGALFVLMRATRTTRRRNEKPCVVKMLAMTM